MKADMNVCSFYYVIYAMYCFLQFHTSASPTRDADKQLIWIQLSFADEELS